jgi:hypothetical protein
MSVEDRLREAVAPDEEGARERALLRLRAEMEAHDAPAARDPRVWGEGRAWGGWRGRPWGRRRGLSFGRPQRRSWRRGRLAGAAVAVVLLLGAALSPPGEAVGDWVRTAVGLKPRINLPTDSAPRVGRPPSGGRLLVSGSGSTWIVEADGTKHRLGAWTGASWSPRGRFVIAWKGRRLAALDPRGMVRWSLTAPRAITEALWSPSGFRVAYRAGSDLRVVAGDGTGDGLLDAGTFRPMAWRPGSEEVLAYSSGGHVDIVAPDGGGRLARIDLPHVPGQLAWSADGTRLYANLHRSIAIYDARGRRTGRIWMPRRRTVTTFVPARGGSLVAVARRERTSSEVALMRPGGPNRVLFRADGRFTRLRFSPSGRWLLADWPLADQWVYLRPGATGAARVLAAANVSRRFKLRGHPLLEGWCCPP